MFGFPRRKKVPPAPMAVALTAHVTAHLDPRDRHRVYELPLAAALGDAGRITGGGSLVGEGGEILNVDISIGLSTLSDDMLNLIVRTLEAAGAPKGSSLRRADGTELRRFGRMEVVALDIDAHGLPDEVYSSNTTRELVAEIAAVMGKAGAYQGLKMLPDRGVLYFHGPDAAAMERAIRDVASFHPLCRGASIRRPPRSATPDD